MLTDKHNVYFSKVTPTSDSADKLEEDDNSILIIDKKQKQTPQRFRLECEGEGCGKWKKLAEDRYSYSSSDEATS